tara:strand:- start:81 stop:341 length:261 start_codon:yes stop_codon:yes gene_type:complete
MDTNNENLIKKLTDALPELCTTKDLVGCGIFKTTPEAIQSRKNGRGPEYLKLSLRRIIYSKEAVIAWLHERDRISKARFNQSKEQV